MPEIPYCIISWCRWCLTAYSCGAGDALLHILVVPVMPYCIFLWSWWWLTAFFEVLEIPYCIISWCQWCLNAYSCGAGDPYCIILWCRKYLTASSCGARNTLLHILVVPEMPYCIQRTKRKEDIHSYRGQYHNWDCGRRRLRCRVHAHEINSHEINSHELNSHQINFLWGQFPIKVVDEMWQGLNQDSWWQGSHVLEMQETQKPMSSKSDYSRNHCAVLQRRA